MLQIAEQILIHYDTVINERGAAQQSTSCKTNREFWGMSRLSPLFSFCDTMLSLNQFFYPMQEMIMNYGLGRIPLWIGLCVLSTCWGLASLAGCSGTRVVAESKIADGDGKVTLTWDNVANASSCHIYYSEAPGVTKQNGKKIANVSNPHTLTGLTRGKVYYFVVTAAQKNRESEESEEISFSVE